MGICSCLKERFVVYCFLLIAAYLYATVGCTTHQEPSLQVTVNTVHPIYLVAYEPSTTQIWQVSPDGSSSSLVYEIAESEDRPVSAIFPSEEIEKLQAYLAEQSVSITVTVDNLLPKPHIERLALSPTKKALSWLEGYIYCIEDSAICFGVKRLMMLNLDTGNSKVLLQMPLHADEDIIYNHISGGPTWSPTGQYVAVLRSIRGGAIRASLIVVNVSTGQGQEIAGTIDSAGPLVWDSDGTTIAWPLSRWHVPSLGGANRLCALDTEECKEIELDGLWVWGWGMDWAPDGKWIVFAATDRNPSIFSGLEIELHLLDVSTGLVQDVPVGINGVLENPRWSPNGQLLAADYRLSVNNFFQSLVIIEPNSGRIVSQLPMQRAESSWVWGRDGRSILVLTGIERARLEVEIFDICDGSLQTIVLPDELATKKIRYLSW